MLNLKSQIFHNKDSDSFTYIVLKAKKEIRDGKALRGDLDKLAEAVDNNESYQD